MKLSSASTPQRVLALSALVSTAGAIQLWQTPADIPSTVPARCRASLTRNITCEVLMPAGRAALGEMVEGDAAAGFCESTCRSSLVDYERTVGEACGNNHYILWQNATGMPQQSPHYLAQSYLWAYDLLCLTDGSALCLPLIRAGKSAACSPCVLKYGARMASSDYGRAVLPEQNFKEMLASCGADASSYPYTYTSSPTQAPTSTTNTSEPTAVPTCQGKQYTVQKGDTCQSISKANSVATDRMIGDNFLDYGCASLTPGMQLCIQDVCETLTIQPGQTCEGIVTGRGFTTIQLQSWNPFMRNLCNVKVNENLDVLVGRSICIGAPGNVTFPTSISDSHRPTATLATTMFSGWESGEVINSPTKGVPNITYDYDPSYTPPTQTVTFNGPEASTIREWLRHCWIIGTDWTLGFDPAQLPSGCRALFDTYCVYHPEKPSPTPPARIPAVCTPDRSPNTILPDPEPVVTPRPVQDGMTKGCNAFHKVVSGDQCDAIARKYKIALGDFYTWNPAVGSDCRNLQLDTYACVGYDERLLPRPTPTPTMAPTRKF